MVIWPEEDLPDEEFLVDSDEEFDFYEVDYDFYADFPDTMI